jgi:hypothetical protein
MSQDYQYRYNACVGGTLLPLSKTLSINHH